MPVRARHHHGSRDRGSVLMLVPAAVLVLIVLGAMAVDSAVAFMAQRELTSAAAAAANDAAGASVSDNAFYRASGGEPDQIVLDATRARDLVAVALAERQTSGVTLLGPPDVRTDLDTVCVTLTGRVDSIFARAIPGAPHSRTVTGRAVATAVQADDRGTPRARAGGGTC